MKIVFFGSSNYSTIVEQSLIDHFGLSLVVTLPDRPLGRKKELTPNPVKKVGLQHTIPVITSEKLTGEVIQKIKEAKLDFLVVTDYGLILPKQLFEIPQYPALNVHHSLLPKYRGPSPAPAAILAGETKSGVTIIKMTERVDAGDILAQESCDITKDETTQSLLTKTNTIGAKLIIDVIKNYNSIIPIKQDESQATFTPRMNKNDGYIDLSTVEHLSPLETENWKLKTERAIRAYYPWPGVWTVLRQGSGRQARDMRIKILPNVIASEAKQSHFLLQPEGKKPMTYKDFLNGYPEASSVIPDLIRDLMQ